MGEVETGEHVRETSIAEESIDRRRLRPSWIERLERGVFHLDAHTGWLWLGAVAFFVVGDTVTTVLGLEFTSVVEAGPVAGVILAKYGLFALVPLKLGAVAVAAILWWITPRPHAVGVPLGLAVLGGLVTVWNATVIALAALGGVGIG